MKLKFTLSNCTWKSEQGSRKNIYGITFTLPGDDNDRPVEFESVIDVKNKTLADFPKTEFKPGKYTYMSQNAIKFLWKHKFPEFQNDKLTGFYIDNIEEVK